MRSLTVGVKLVGSFSIVALIIAIVAGVGYVNMGAINVGLDSLFTGSLLPVEQLGRANTALYQMRGDVYKYIVLPDQREDTRRAIDTDVALVNTQMDLYRTSPLTAEERSALGAFETSWSAYQSAIQALLADVDANDQTAVTAGLQDGGSAVTARRSLDHALSVLLDLNDRGAEQIEASAEVTYATATQTMLVAAIVGMALALTLGLWMSRTITVPLGQVARAAAGIATGNLNQHVTVMSQDEVGQVAGAFGTMIVYLQNMAAAAERIAQGDLTVDIQVDSEQDVLGTAFARMTQHLRGLVGRVVGDAESVQSAASLLTAAATQSSEATNQIAATIQQVANGIQQQSQSTAVTAHSVEQMRRSILNVSEGSQHQNLAVAQATQLTSRLAQDLQHMATTAQSGAREANEAARVTQSGAGTVEATLQGMSLIQAKVEASARKVHEMGDRSNQIGAIVETIDDIASQTNLLALNAAIEAARAGEHGKGFAVVADEVRKLAEKSAVATKEIAELIQAMQTTAREAIRAMEDGAQQVQRGVVQATQSGEALTNIRKCVDNVTVQVQTIAQSSQSAAGSVQTLVTAMDEVGVVARTNQAASEELTAGSSIVSDAVQSIASVSEESSASVEEVVASAEEMTAQSEEVTANAHALADMAQALRAAVAIFRLASTPGADRQTESLDPVILTRATSARPHRRPLSEDALTVRSSSGPVTATTIAKN